MLSLDPDSLAQEIMAAERLAKQRYNAMRDLVRGYTGPAYTDHKGAVTGLDGSGIDYNPENHVYEYIRLTVPQLLMDNPRVQVRSRRLGAQAQAATAIKHGLNRWVRDVHIRDTLDPIAYDFLLCWGVALTVRAPNPAIQTSTGDLAMWPSTTRISPRRFFMDPMASTPSASRYMGHKYIVDKEDLVELARKDPESGWNLDAIEALSAGRADDDEVRRGTGRNQDIPDRGEVGLYEMWVPELELEDSPGQRAGFHGALLTMSLSTQGTKDTARTASFVRKPRPYYGPRWGPYTIMGVYSVPDEQYPLSPLIATDGQMRDLNDHALAVSKASRKYKQVVFANSSDPRMAQKIANAEDLSVIPVEGIDRSKFLQAEMGGASDTQLKYLALARDRLDRNSGISESMRGNIGSGATATEASIAERAMANSIEYVKLQWRAGVERILTTAGWYLYHDDEMIFPLGSGAAEEAGSEEAWFVGGDPNPGSGYTFDDLELEIEAHSMERPDERTTLRRTLDFVNAVAATAPVSLQTPHINWDRIYSILAEGYAIPGGDELFDPEVYQKVVGMMAAQMQGEESPLLGRQLGQREPPRARASRATSGVEGLERGSQNALMQGPSQSPNVMGGLM